MARNTTSLLLSSMEDLIVELFVIRTSAVVNRGRKDAISSAFLSIILLPQQKWLPFITRPFLSFPNFLNT